MPTPACYLRKSVEQSGVSDEAKSVTRQLEHARAYAERKGWGSIPGELVFQDDGVSGALFGEHRPGLARLLNALKPKPQFDILIMSEESRLGREAIETAYVLKRIIDSGVRVHFYLEGRERTLDSAMDKVMLSLTSFASEVERERAQQRTYDALVRNARLGRCVGNVRFGYRNAEIRTGDGRRSHVELVIVPEEA